VIIIRVAKGTFAERVGNRIAGETRTIGARKEQQIARAIMLHTEPIADGSLAFGQAVEIAHSASMNKTIGARQRRPLDGEGHARTVRRRPAQSDRILSV
jgi:hypothetical protein